MKINSGLICMSNKGKEWEWVGGWEKKKSMLIFILIS